MAVRTELRAGTRLASYTVSSVLGRGAMSVVYAAQDARLGRRVALKILAPSMGESERFRERFLRESRIAAAIDHPNVIPIYEAGEADGLLYIAMRLVAGTDLRALLAREAPLAPERALRMVGQAASALDAAHASGLLHRDVKPGNILLASDQGTGEHVYLSDFGLAVSGGAEADEAAGASRSAIGSSR
jgi:serine/threonine protein kinase